MTAKVTRVEIDSYEGDLTVELTIVRSHYRDLRGGIWPKSEDVPEDIRAALTDWLAGRQQ